MDDSNVSEESHQHLADAMDKLSKKFSGESKNIARLHESFADISQEMIKLHKRIDGIVKANQQMKADIKQLRENERLLEKRIKQLEDIEMVKKQISNDNNLIITNLPKFRPETELKQIILKIGEQVQCTISDEEILDVYQAENKKSNTYPIIVKMTNKIFKSKCMDFRRAQNKIDIKKIANNLDNGNKNINFHHLMEKELADLLQKSKAAAKDTGFKFIWFNGSSILARKTENSKVFKITCEDDIKKIK